MASESAATTGRIQSFSAFYTFYQSQHRRLGTRVLHVVGTTGTVATVAYAAAARKPAILPLALICGYGFAWIGHFFHEHNRPATFKYPLWSLLADFKMWFRILTGQEAWKLD